jgi:hypothetical protein
MTWIHALSAFAHGQSLGSWVLREAALGPLGPVLGPFVTDPKAIRGAARRIGDAVVWEGEGGTRVLAHLDALSDSQDRIQAAVDGLATTVGPALSVLPALSMIRIGVTALSGAAMLWRLAALRKRVDEQGQRLRDIEGHLSAAQKALLMSAINNLALYESPSGGKPDTLGKALEQANLSANTYKNLATDEAQDGRRIDALRARGRLYLLGLLTELRCHLLDDKPDAATRRIDEEMPALKEVAKATFAETVGAEPEAYLRPEFAADGVTLELMAEVYGQARAAGAVDASAASDAAGLFEQVRPRLADRRGLPLVPRLTGKSWRAGMLQKLRNAAGCVEETSRIVSLRLLIDEVRGAGRSIRELLDELAAWKAKPGKDGGEAEVWAYRLT